MIFILLGILILIAAFVIALVSLIREQKNSSSLTHSHGKTEELEPEHAGNKEIAEAPDIPTIKKEAPLHEEREPFPWEIAKAQESDVKAENTGTEQAENSWKPEILDGVAAKKEDIDYNPTLPSGGVVEISMKDMIDHAKNSEGS